jgi:hypothetical protein
MRRRLRWLVVFAVVVSFVSLEGVSLAGQATTARRATAGVKKADVPRTSWGDPDLQGIWNGSTITPLQRPKEFVGKEFFTEVEAARFEKEALAKEEDQAPAPPPGESGTYNQIWFDNASRVLPNRRTALVVDPPDGRIPFTPDGQKAEALSRALYGKGNYSSWLGLDTGERCLTDGPQTIYTSGYNNNYQIFQSPGYVTILHELYNELRIIPLDGSAHDRIPNLVGDARGHWEGDTLVVDTTNFPDHPSWRWQNAWRAVRPSTHIVERFRRVDAQTIDYQFTLQDPVMYTRPWTAAYPLTNNQASRGVTSGQLYEYACHEGNYALVDVLNGARKQEGADETAKRGSSK